LKIKKIGRLDSDVAGTLKTCIWPAKKNIW